MRHLERLVPRLAALTALAIACSGFAVWVWPTKYRDIPVAAGARGYVIAARENRLTGAVDVLTRKGWERLGIAAAPAETLEERMRRLANER